MATSNRDELLLQFYSECQKQGYSDMKDNTESLKAKVIATDLGLKYNKIDKLYEEAKLAAEKKSQQDSKVGTLLFSCYSSSVGDKEQPFLDIFLCDDNSYYGVVNGKRVYGTPRVIVEDAILPQTYYREPSTTYYGMSYNGMSTGSVSYDPGGPETKMEKTEGGYIVIKLGDEGYTIRAVKPADRLNEAFKRDEVFKQYFNGDRLVLDNMASASLSYNGDIYATLRKSNLPKDECLKIADLLIRMGSNRLPPTDQELYEKARKLAASQSAADVASAATIFKSISDYKDSKQLALEAEQLGKEKAILEKEKNKKRGKLYIGVGIVVLILIAALSMLLSSKSAQRNSEIHEALSANAYSTTFEDSDRRSHHYHIMFGSEVGEVELSSLHQSSSGRPYEDDGTFKYHIISKKADGPDTEVTISWKSGYHQYYMYVKMNEAGKVVFATINDSGRTEGRKKLDLFSLR